MAIRNDNGGSNIVELLGLLVAAIGLLVTLSDKLQPINSTTQPPAVEGGRQQNSPRRQLNYQEWRSLPERGMPKSYKRQDRLMPSKADDRLPRR